MQTVERIIIFLISLVIVNYRYGWFFVSPHTDAIYKDIAHMWVASMFTLMLVRWKSFYLWIVIGLSVAETIAFLTLKG